jgi:hypothetical protein
MRGISGFMRKRHRTSSSKTKLKHRIRARIQKRKRKRALRNQQLLAGQRIKYSVSTRYNINDYGGGAGVIQDIGVVKKLRG